MSDDRYRSVVDNSPYGIYRVTYDGQFITVNPALCAMVGYTADELFASGISILYESPCARQALLAEYGNRPHGKAVEVPWVRKDGTTIITRVWVYAERDAAGRIAHLDGYVEDVTRVRETERALRHAEKLASIGQVISGVAHELNNPLSAILLFAEDLLAVDRAPEESEALTIITQQARRSRAIVRDLLSFVRSRDVTRAPICPIEISDRIGRTLQPQLDEIGVSLRIDVQAVDPIHVDHAGVEQVITNLVMNAAQATGRGGNVWIRGRADRDAYQFEVVDDGPGIPLAALPKIFEPFYTTKPMGHGTGLGLSVSLGIVQQHGGTILAENRDPADGPGARLIVRLPAPARALAVADAAHAAVEKSEQKSDGILVA